VEDYVSVVKATTRKKTGPHRNCQKNAKLAKMAISLRTTARIKKGLKMKDETFNKWCSKCGVVTTTLSAQFCPDCGDGPLQATGGAREVKVVVQLPAYDYLPNYGLTTVEAHDLFDWVVNHEAIKLTIRMNDGVPVITSVNGELLKGD
jgi:ribosomal protein S27AE